MFKAANLMFKAANLFACVYSQLNKVVVLST